MPGAQPTSEAGELALTFNEMLDRLELERREATGRVLAGQEPNGGGSPRSCTTRSDRT
jgi:hypothetical protein